MVDRVSRDSSDKTSRYDTSYFLNDGSYTYLPTRRRVAYRFSSADVFYTITSDDVGRFDYLASRVYNRPDLWWAIAEANKIGNVFRVRPGTVIRVPALDRLLRWLRSK